MNELIHKYIEDKVLAWSPTTQRSELYRLKAVAQYLDGNPVTLWANIQDLKPYSRVTTWTRVSQFWDFLIEQGIKQENPYVKFRQKNAKAFKNTYSPSTPRLGFAEAVRRIKLIRNDDDRNLGLQIIGSGERFAEAVQRTDRVVGKGSKPRDTFRPGSTELDYGRSYHSFRNSLKSVGLKPHALRKLFASKLVEKGAKEQDLLKIMGWSSMNTAKYYLQPKKDEEIKHIIFDIHGEIK